MEGYDSRRTGKGLTEGNKSGDSSLHDWFNKSKSSDGKKGWVQIGGKYAGKACARQPGQTTKPKCGSSKMKRNLNKKEEDAAFRRKNAKDGNPDRKGKAINVKTESVMDRDIYDSLYSSYLQMSEEKKEGKKDACYNKVKASAKVWPSAYASGRLVQCRKKGADNYGKSAKKEEMEYEGYMPDPTAKREAKAKQLRDREQIASSQKGTKYETSKTEDPNKLYRRRQAIQSKTKMRKEETGFDKFMDECWKTHERVPGTVPGSKGSCRPKGSAKK